MAGSFFALDDTQNFMMRAKCGPCSIPLLSLPDRTKFLQSSLNQQAPHTSKCLFPPPVLHSGSYITRFFDRRLVRCPWEFVLITQVPSIYRPQTFKRSLVLGLQSVPFFCDENNNNSIIRNFWKEILKEIFNNSDLFDLRKLLKVIRKFDAYAKSILD
jgi:hypothetical protein